MGTIYIIMVVILIGLAISDLIVGVSNDAVNFLNSALGSKALPFKVIMIVAALGILVGATFSSGMMEVARKGIFHPQYFYFSEIMIIFLAVMITDVILLDVYNTFGMPTSTTVSIVFELLGAAVGITLIKVYTDPDALAFGEYINSGKALAIIAGILLSVVIAFSAGAIVQYLSRMVFTFDYGKKIKRYGAIWGGIAISAITFFILIKGAKGASFMSDGLKEMIKENAWLIIGASFVGWTILLQIISSFTKFKILRFIVLIGTFALAMAFAGNDLVNFIGVPLAGYESYKSFAASGAGADTFLMAELAGKVKTPTVFLLIAGLIMVVTLWFSKKARSVTETEINLGRQEEGSERFESFAISRAIVRGITRFGGKWGTAFSGKIGAQINKRFDKTAFVQKQIALGKEAPAFDKVRASVILVVASILISIGTSLKLPLSTTYVTFMVAMGASLADRAWGRESAVYRISGVLSVIGGWFLTAFSAFTAAFIFAILFKYGGFFAIGIMVLIAMYTIYRTHIIHHKRSEEKKELEEEVEEEVLTGQKMLEKTSVRIVKVLSQTSEVVGDSVVGLVTEDLAKLDETYKSFEKLNRRTMSLKDNVGATIDKLEDNSIESGQHYIQLLNYLREITHSTNRIVGPSQTHVDNNHKPLIEEQIQELKNIYSGLNILFQGIIKGIKTHDHSAVPEILKEQELVAKEIKRATKMQIKRIKEHTVGTRNSMLYMELLPEFKNLSANLINVLKSHRDFIEYVKGDEKEETPA